MCRLKACMMPNTSVFSSLTVMYFPRCSSRRFRRSASCCKRVMPSFQPVIASSGSARLLTLFCQLSTISCTGSAPQSEPALHSGHLTLLYASGRWCTRMPSVIPRHCVHTDAGRASPHNASPHPGVPGGSVC